MLKMKASNPSGIERIQRPEPLTLRGSMLFEGDALTVLRRLPSGSVRCAVTSPPYWGLRDYGIEEQIGLEVTMPQFLHRLVAIFAEVKRVLTCRIPDDHMVACETDAGVSDTTLSSPASAYCS